MSRPEGGHIFSMPMNLEAGAASRASSARAGMNGELGYQGSLLRSDHRDGGQGPS
ncbi:hypothetical protein [Sphingomonas sp. IW22]|jgi:hypothetical protein|uniref:hypothetical protein n=1 Tax=Sphingomonas sp. IW22 TaxID=3242489 RepID=UPI003522E65E